MAQAFTPLPGCRDAVIDHAATLEEALYMWAKHPAADFTDCLLAARAAHLGRARFVTVDVGASKLPRAKLLAWGCGIASQPRRRSCRLLARRVPASNSIGFTHQGLAAAGLP